MRKIPKKLITQVTLGSYQKILTPVLIIYILFVFLQYHLVIGKSDRSILTLSYASDICFFFVDLWHDQLVPVILLDEVGLQKRLM